MTTPAICTDICRHKKASRMVFEFLKCLQRRSIEINLFLPVIANISWLIMLVAQYSETDSQYAFVLVNCRHFKRRIEVIISFEVQLQVPAGVPQANTRLC